MKLSIINRKGPGKALASAEGAERVHLVYEPAYRPGDAVRLEVGHPGHYLVRLEDTLPPTAVYLSGTQAEFSIPFGVDRACFSPRSFVGKRHFLEVMALPSEKALEYRNLALNPHDTAANRGIFPHMTTNVTYPDSLRNKIFPDRGLFAPRNVIDGILANESHRLYPHQSWGINRDPNAMLTCDFGRPVDIDCIKLAIRGEFPHDSWWVQATVAFSDGSEEHLTIAKTLELQSFEIHVTGVTSLSLCKLIKADDPSLFPALSLLEVWGRDTEPQ